MEFKSQRSQLTTVTIKEEDGASTASINNYGSDSVHSEERVQNSRIARPLNIQQLEKALSLDGFLRQVNSILGDTK